MQDKILGLNKAFRNLNKKLSKEKIHKLIFGTREKESVFRHIIVYGLLICIGFVYLYPMLYMFSYSFMDRDDLLDTSIRWIPSSIYLLNYIDAANSMDFFSSLIKGFVIAGAPTICNVLICLLIGYGFARFRFKGKTIMLGVLVFSYILPSQVTMIPTYVLYNNMGIVGTLWAFVLPALFGNGLNAPIFILIFYQFFKQMPQSLIEAAHIDGAGYFKSFLKIAVPLSKPAILTVFLFSFVWYWNESYLTELYVRGLTTQSIWSNLVIQLKNFDTSFETLATVGGTGTSLNESVRMAATSLSIVPLLIVYFILQRYFVESVDRSGITGS